MAAGVSTQKIINQTFPLGCDGLVLPYVALLSATGADSLDMRNFIQNGHFSTPQSVFIDNIQNGADVFMQAQITNMIICMRAGRQGWIPIPIIPGAEAFAFSSTGGVNVPFFFVNIPMPASVWGA